MAGGNGFIDQYAAIKKLKLHGVGLWGMQAVVALVMSVIAVVAGESHPSLIKDAIAFCVYFAVYKLDILVTPHNGWSLKRVIINSNENI